MPKSLTVSEKILIKLGKWDTFSEFEQKLSLQDMAKSILFI